MTVLGPTVVLANLITRDPGPSERGRLIRGKRYKILRSFIDRDGDFHPENEQWIFVGGGFSNYDNLLLLYVQPNRDIYRIPLQSVKEHQKDIFDHWEEYFGFV